MFTYSFEKLEVWKLSRSLVRQIYTITHTFPDKEKYGLTQQIRRAAISIASNLAEGTSRQTPKENANFTQIAFSSLMELLNQLIIANDLEYAPVMRHAWATPKIETLCKKLTTKKRSKSKSDNV